jgi:hypothetical protein
MKRVPAHEGILREVPGAAYEVPAPPTPAEERGEPPARGKVPEPRPAAPAAPAVPAAGRYPRRVGRTINVSPLMLEILDDALRRIAVAAGRDVQRSACYEAMWVVAIRHLDEVVGLVARDPEGRAIAEEFAAELSFPSTSTRGGVGGQG